MAAREEDATEGGRAGGIGLVPVTVTEGSWGRTLALALGVGALYAYRLDVPAFFDNEGRYAAVGREMLLSHDWITPRLDATLFLNKPPLLYWLTAGLFGAIGVNEWARLTSVVASVVTLIAVCRLGTLLYDGTTGLLAGTLLASSLGFGLEARTMRPDAILVATVALAVLCWWHAERADPARRTRWLLGLYAALGIGVLAKGLPPVIVTAIPVGVAMLRRHGLRGIARLRPALGLAVMGAIVLPWHVAVSLRHAGFAWDYVVNQHLLFFLDKKLPRDSTGDPLGFFWIAFCLRALPWIVLVPLAAREGRAGARARCSAVEDATCFVWVWMLGVLGFFSLAPSRLEHYALPALPAAALLAARGALRLVRGDVGRGAWTAFAALAIGLVLGGGSFLALRDRLFAGAYWVSQVPELPPLIVPGGVLLIAIGIPATLAAVMRRGGAFVAIVGAGAVLMLALVTVAQARAEALFSWRPIAEVVRQKVPPATEVVFEAPEEYQIVGGLTFYTGRRITLLEPPGFVPPTYLQQLAGDMFLHRADFTRRWQSGEPLVFVSDSQQRRDTADGLVPPPFRILAHFGDRWLLTNVPAAD